ncbi:MotE family protein [Pelagicoccus mobilis]|uniref:Magnesium transporter MgtE intracellular domain-containing protein n=1 Tax=Pelagicoccus mobilis TaxID=415221 RepID=A0A934S3L8_9BACT|nr:hypothetical protein [Pelagicoccus mobilis]MBK1878433.1 hypothetical protein [Pelagicoccus mobilis]
MKILNKPVVLAILALLLMVGTQFVALKMYWSELFPEPKSKALVVTREEPEPFEWGFASDYITNLEEELNRRIAALEVRESELAEYEARLGADRAEIEEIKSQVELMREHLLEGIVKLEADEKDNLKRLAKTYALLDPEAAVSIFNELDDSTVVKILFFMDSETVGAVLEEMVTANGNGSEQVKRAAKISDMLRLFTDNSKNNLQQT